MREISKRKNLPILFFVFTQSLLLTPMLSTKQALDKESFFLLLLLLSVRFDWKRPLLCFSLTSAHFGSFLLSKSIFTFDYENLYCTQVFFYS